MEWYVGTEWKSDKKGLEKKVLSLNFTKLDKPHLVSKVRIKIEDVKDIGDRPSQYLVPEKILCSQELEMGTALTPIDYYLEILTQQMIVGEKALCCIQTKSGTEIKFILTLERIIETKEFHKLTVKEMYNLAGRYKENGVTIFKQYPQFAHDYFAQAAKCLISFKPFDGLEKNKDGVSSADMESLFIQIQTNLAACLLTAQRYRDVVYQTKFVETIAEPSEKSVYRRAMALANLNDFAEAKKTIEKVENFKEKREFAKLYQRIMNDWKMSNDKYKSFVQRMFSL